MLNNFAKMNLGRTIKMVVVMKGCIGVFGSHQDHKESCAVNPVKGVYKCFACGEAGSFFDLAKSKMYDKPHLYIPNGNGYTNNVDFTSAKPSKTTTPKPKSSKPPVPPPNVELLKSTMEQFKQNLKDNPNKFPLSYIRLLNNGTQDLIDVYDVGLDDRGNLAFGHHDKNGELIGIKIHKKHTIGNGKSKLYLKHFLGSYDHDKVLYICEGEKDAIVLCSYGYQALSGTCGAISIPKDENGDYEVDFIQYFNNDIVFVYDNDSAGCKGAEKWGMALKHKDNIIVEILDKINLIITIFVFWDTNRTTSAT
jgi:hypothetical protein